MYKDWFRDMELQRLTIEIAQLDGTVPEYIWHQVQVMYQLGYTGEISLSIIRECVKENRMTPLEIAAKAYEKYAEALSFQLGGSQVMGWDELDLIAQAAFLSFSEESHRLYQAQQPKSLDARNFDLGAGNDDTIPF